VLRSILETLLKHKETEATVATSSGFVHNTPQIAANLLQNVSARELAKSVKI